MPANPLGGSIVSTTYIHFGGGAHKDQDEQLSLPPGSRLSPALSTRLQTSRVQSHIEPMSCTSNTPSDHIRVADARTLIALRPFDRRRWPDVPPVPSPDGVGELLTLFAGRAHWAQSGSYFTPASIHGSVACWPISSQSCLCQR